MIVGPALRLGREIHFVQDHRAHAVDDSLAPWRRLKDPDVTIRCHLYEDDNYLIDGDISKDLTCYPE